MEAGGGGGGMNNNASSLPPHHHHQLHHLHHHHHQQQQQQQQQQDEDFLEQMLSTIPSWPPQPHDLPSSAAQPDDHSPPLDRAAAAFQFPFDEPFNGNAHGFAPGSLHGNGPPPRQFHPPPPPPPPQNFGGVPGAAAAAGPPASASTGGSSGATPQKQSRVRARRGQATDPHSIAERLRRERIAERMKALQELVPNANKTDKASMLDEIIDYVKFLQLQVKVVSMSRLGGAAAGLGPLVADMTNEGGVRRNSNAAIPAALAANSNMTATENQVARLMEEDMGSAMQYLQGKGLCLMPISLATAISTAACSSRPPAPPSRAHISNNVVNNSPTVDQPTTAGAGLIAADSSINDGSKK